MSASSAYLLLLGSAPACSWAELEATLASQAKLERLTPQLAKLSQLPPTLTGTELMRVLGGTVKVARLLSTLPQGQELASIKTELLATPADEKITFALAEWGRDHLPRLDLAELKKALTAQGRTVRYLESPRQGLSASVLLHQAKVRELVLASTNETIYLAETEAVQDIDAWTKVDRGKPFAERKRGLLPPKVARLMLNLALGEQVWQTEALAQLTLLDPFSGAGTILIEAERLGLTQVYGSDLDPAAVQGARANLTAMTTLSPERIFLSDATHLLEPPFASQSLDFIVTEPFLGKQTPRPDQLANIERGLFKLYLGAFKAWRPWLKDGAKIVHVFPLWPTRNQAQTTREALFDKLADLGYNLSSEPITYARAQAKVAREIRVFTYVKS